MSLCQSFESPADPATSNASEDGLPSASTESGGSVLIVDDNPDNLRVLEGFLRNCGCRVRPALNGEQALRATAKEAPDIILLDIRMPGMDGYQVCERLKANPATQEIPVIFISALQSSDDKVRAFASGGVDYVVKPFHADEVVSRVKTHLELSRIRKHLKSAAIELDRHVQERTAQLHIANATLTKISEQEQILNELMRLALSRSNLRGFLGRALDILGKRLHWRGIEEQNLIFLCERGRDETTDTLVLTAGKCFSRADRHDCQVISPTNCRCFHSILNGHPSFHCGGKESCDALGKIYGKEHARYWIPLLEENRVFGAMVHYLPADVSEQNVDKPFFARVGEVLSLGVLRREADDKLVHQALHDQLTGIPNRVLFKNRLELAVCRAQRAGDFGAILFLDLDRFKSVNDALGHDAGDRLLVEISRRLAETTRQEDTLARWGGDEFLLLVSSIGTTLADAGQCAMRIADKLRARINEPLDLFGAELSVGVSIGIVVFPSSMADDDLLKCADTAMFRAKQSGRNALQFFEPSMQVEAENALRMERRLRDAIASDTLTLHYQPQTDAEGRLMGLEALLRWPQPDGSFIPPGEFIPLAEESGLIIPLGEWVINRALSQFGQLVGEHNVAPHITLAVNVSGRQFNTRKLQTCLESALAASGLTPRRLTLEVTESVLMQNLETTLEIMHWLEGKGIELAVDDFGTGYSSLTYLKKFPVRQLKIDQAFVRGIHQDPHDAVIVSAIIGMAHNLGMEVIAEGVEEEEELQFLKMRGCQNFQGFYFSRPRSWDEVVPMILSGKVVASHASSP